ncbi:MAG TPA: XrtA/PEP-CTERM system histidine kinase PrsK [Gammaproteobacteria bacterium]
MNNSIVFIEMGLAGYALAAVINTLFALLLVTGWRGRYQGAFLLIAVITNALWSGLLILGVLSKTLSFWSYYLAEIVRSGAWLAFLLSMMGEFREKRLIRPEWSLVNTVYLVVAVNLLICAAAYLAGEKPINENLSVWPLLGLLGLPLIGLVLVEQIYRNTPDVKRWTIKFLCVGIGAMFAYDIYLYSNALLFRQLNMVYWSARGFVGVIIVPLLAVSVARSPQFSTGIFISRHVVFYTTALTGVGAYLLLMAAGGYYLKAYGGTWGGLTQTVFLFGAILLLVLIMLSGQARSRLKVFIVKHFFRNKYDYRLEWLRLINTLSDSASELSLQQRAIKCLARIVSARGGCLWMRGEATDYELVATWNMKCSLQVKEPHDSPFVEFLKKKEWVIDLGEVPPPGGLLIPEWLDDLKTKGAWLVVPLINDDGVFGFVILESAGKRTGLTWEDTDFLKTVGRQITSYLALEEAAEQLSQARQFEAYNKLAAFVIHDINNLMSQLSLVTQNAVKHMGNPLFVQDAMQTIENSVEKMNGLLRKLRKGNANSEKTICLNDLLKQVVEECGTRKPPLMLEIAQKDIELLIDAEQLSMAIRHLISNAQDATSADGIVKICMSADDERVRLKVEDNGCGMTDDFVKKRLFRPFDSTKTNKGMGIGAFEVKEYVQSIGGSISVDSAVDRGTSVTITLPRRLETKEMSVMENVEVVHG